MPQPFANPIGGFTSGFSQGTQMGLLLRQQKQADLKQRGAAEAKRIDQGMKKLKMGVELSKIKHPTYRKQGMTLINQALKEAGDMVGIDPSQLQEELEWSDGYDPYLKELDTAFQAFGKNQDRSMLQKSISETLFRAGDFIEEEKLKRLETTTGERVEAAVGEQEAGRVQQALDIRALQQDPRFTEGLTPEQQAQVGAPSAERGLLARGGAVGEALLKEGAKAPTPGLKGKLEEWMETRTAAGLKTSTKDVEGYLRKGGRTQANSYNEWKDIFTKEMKRPPTKEEIRKKLISDPYGIFEPAAAENNNTAEGYLGSIGE